MSVKRSIIPAVQVKVVDEEVRKSECAGALITFDFQPFTDQDTLSCIGSDCRQVCAR